MQIAVTLIGRACPSSSPARFGQLMPDVGMPTSTRIPSRGWRNVWANRLGVGIGAGILVAYGVYLFGWPWASLAASASLLIVALVLLVGDLLLESQSVRWISLSNEGVTLGYLFGTKAIPWFRLRRSEKSAPFGPEKAFHDFNAGGFSRRVHWLTPEQASAVAAHGEVPLL